MMFKLFEVPMTGRNIHEEHRVASSLELLLDLAFVVAVAAAASQFHHALGAGHIGSALYGFGLTFFAIWWAWLNYAWFTSAYDTQDRGYRLLSLVLMFGALMLAAGIPALFNGNPTIGTIGYILMRLALVAQWLRAAHDDTERRATCLRYAFGITIVQGMHTIRLFLASDWQTYALWPVLLLEVLTPVWAERTGETPWHAHHIVERYALFTIIVLGEGVLGATRSISTVITQQGWSFGLLNIGLAVTSIVFALWWRYFQIPLADALHHRRLAKLAFAFGYGHYFVLAALAALGTGLELVADAQLAPAFHTEHRVTASLAIEVTAGAIAVFLGTLSVIQHVLFGYTGRRWRALLAGYLFLALALWLARSNNISVALWALVAAPVMVMWIDDCANCSIHGH